MTLEQVIEIIERYKLRIPPTVYYELLADIRNEQEPEIESREQWCDYANDNCISRYDVEDLIQKKIKALKENTDGME